VGRRGEGTGVAAVATGGVGQVASVEGGGLPVIGLFIGLHGILLLFLLLVHAVKAADEHGHGY